MMELKPPALSLPPAPLPTGCANVGKSYWLESLPTILTPRELFALRIHAARSQVRRSYPSNPTVVIYPMIHLSITPETPIRVYPDGNAWCAILGTDPQADLTGFGATPTEAIMELETQLPSSDALTYARSDSLG